MIRSRVTLATIDAAAIDMHVASPRMMGRCGMGMGALSVASLFVPQGGIGLLGSAQAAEGFTNPLTPKQPHFPAVDRQEA